MDNIYKKLQEARTKIGLSGIKPTGKNAFGNGFFYFELSDFMPTTNSVFNEIGLIGITDFSPPDMATLTIVDCESQESRIVFSCYKAEAGLRQGSPIQNIGAQIKYMRRYLWMQAIELTEDDSVDQLADDQKISIEDHGRTRQKTSPPLPPSLAELKARIENSNSLENLSALWAGIPAKFKVQELINLKDLKKQALLPADRRIKEALDMQSLVAICDTLTEAEQAEFDDLISQKIDQFKKDEANEE